MKLYKLKQQLLHYLKNGNNIRVDFGTISGRLHGIVRGFSVKLEDIMESFNKFQKICVHRICSG